MATAQTELTTAQTEFTTDQTDLIEKLNCLEFETSQLNRAYQLWRSNVEEGTASDWMAAAIRITYDALITFYLEVSTILAAGPHASSARLLAPLESAAFEISGILAEESQLAEPSAELLAMTELDRSEQTELTTEQTELIEKLNCLELETAQLNRAYQLWRCSVEQGTAPDWMTAAIRSTYDVLIRFYLEVSTIQAEVPYASSANHVAPLELADCDVSGILEEESMTVAPSLELLAMTELDCSAPEVPAAISLPSITVSEQLNIQEAQQEEEADFPHFSGTQVVQLEAADCEISDILEEENTTAEPSPKLLPMTEPDWSEPEVPAAISLPSTADTISQQFAIHRQQEQEEEAGAQAAVIHIPATLANWLQRSWTRMPLLAGSVAILIVVGGVMGIYLAHAHPATPPILSVQNSATQAVAGAVAIPPGQKAEFRFDPDLVVAPLGKSFVLNAVLSRGSDIASVAAQIDYDADLLQFVGVSQGGFLVKDGQQAVLAQRNDPSTGVVRISAEKAPGHPGVSGDGPVFALSFQARKRGMATVSIVPGAHDSQGRRIDMTGSQVSVRVD